MGADDVRAVELAVSHQGELNSLRTWLGLAAIEDMEVRRVPGAPVLGEQGAFDVLSVVAGSTGLVAALKPARQVFSPS
ncbi:hypothetical protein AB0451_32490 [Streptomyces sp. NPDC052000]|uniref:effector-associated constant component EACC1 n=1 Tax=Streptomyces sp. NPDC052000 TaxID=3155676 RepID=UPI00344C751B